MQRDRDRHKTDEYKLQRKKRRMQSKEREQKEEMGEMDQSQTDIRSFFPVDRAPSTTDLLPKTRAEDTCKVQSCIKTFCKPIRQELFDREHSRKRKRECSASCERKSDASISDSHPSVTEESRNDDPEQNTDLDLLYSVTLGNEKARDLNLSQISAAILSNSKVIFLSRIKFLLDCLSTKETEPLYLDTGKSLTYFFSLFLYLSFFLLSLSSS